MKREPEYDYFLVYAPADRSWSEGFLRQMLEDAGLTCHSSRDFAPGHPRQLALEEAIERSRRVILVLTPAFFIHDESGESTTAELLGRQFGQDSNTWPVVPLLLQPVELPARLRLLTAVDLTQPDFRQEEIARLIRLAGSEPAAPRELPPPPYMGMRPFTEEDSLLFFGRNDEIDALELGLHRLPFLALTGASGSGKSSLVAAGLVPRLHRSTRFGPGKWLVRTLRPGADPNAALDKALGDGNSDPETAVAAILSGTPGATRLLLVIDQFEELFTTGQPPDERFQERLQALAILPKCYVLIVARNDFYPQLVDCQLWPQIEQNRFDLRSMDEDDLADAIRLPAESANVYVEAALVERLVADAGDEPGVLPFLQETMILLWAYVERRYLPLSAYDALVLPRDAYFDLDQSEPRTGLQVAIAQQAERTIAGIPPEAREKVGGIFLKLVQFGEGRPTTRRRVRRDQLNLDETGSQTLEQLVAGRLLVLSGETDAAQHVDIAHESLLTAWPRLQRWIIDGEAGEKERRRYVADAHIWEQKGRAGDYAYIGRQLATAEAWAKRHSEEVDIVLAAFLSAGRRRQRQTLALRLVVAGAGIAVVVFLLNTFLENRRQGALRATAATPRAEYRGGEVDLGNPPRPISISPFALDQYEVSVGQFRLCLEAGRCAEPGRGSELLGEEKYPVLGLTAVEAANYCAWQEGTLPTVAQWEYAVRGDTYRAWPWGDRDEPPTSQHVNMFVVDAGSAAPDTPVAVDDPNYAAGSSEDGVYHLLGNAEEWSLTITDNCDETEAVTCPSWDSSTATRPVALWVVGGSWLFNIDATSTNRVSDYRAVAPTVSNGRIGFRCAYEAGE